MNTNSKTSAFANDRLRLSITDNCNFTCSYCTNEGQKHNQGNFISIENVKKLSQKIKDENIYIKKLNITGGEPLLHKKLLEIVEICSGISDCVTLNTNGSLLTQEMVSRLHDAGVYNIKFGIDSLSQNTTKPCLKEMNVDTEKLLENLLYSVDLMPRSSVNIVLSEFNYNEFDNIFSFIVSNNINWVEFLELIQYDFRNTQKFPKPGPGFNMLMNQKETHLTEVKYNKNLAKYICVTNSGLIMQFAEDFCLRRVCQNLWTRVNSKCQLTPCIKAQTGINIENKSSLESQIRECNALMCNGVENHIPRSYEGELLQLDSYGDYIAPDYSNRFNTHPTQFDP